jgi:heme O synthase-like polyprenyltransferase
MIKNIKLANRVIQGVVVVLAIALGAVIAVDYVSDYTSMLLGLTFWILFLLMSVALFAQATIKRESFRYFYLAASIMLLVFLVLSLLHHPTRHWP